MKTKLPHFLLFCTVLFWGVSFPLMTYLLDMMTPMQLALGRFFLPAILSMIYIIFFRVKIQRIDCFRFFIAGITGIFGFAFFINTGQQTMSAGAGSFIVNCNPLFTSLIGFFILKQKIKRYFWIGIIVCILGIIIISLEKHEKVNFNFGSIYLFAAAVLVSCYFHLIKPLTNKYGPLTTFCYTILLGTLPMLFWSIDTYELIINSSTETRIAIIWLSIISTLIPYYTWTYSVGYFGANKASFFLFLIPIISIIIDKLIFEIIPNSFTIFGGLIILVSVLIIMILNQTKVK